MLAMSGVQFAAQGVQSLTECMRAGSLHVHAPPSGHIKPATTWGASAIELPWQDGAVLTAPPKNFDCLCCTVDTMRERLALFRLGCLHARTRCVSTTRATDVQNEVLDYGVYDVH
jgi:hypothetical protein